MSGIFSDLDREYEPESTYEAVGVAFHDWSDGMGGLDKTAALRKAVQAHINKHHAPKKVSCKLTGDVYDLVEAFENHSTAGVSEALLHKLTMLEVRGRNREMRDRRNQSAIRRDIDRAVERVQMCIRGETDTKDSLTEFELRDEADNLCLLLSEYFEMEDKT